MIMAANEDHDQLTTPITRLRASGDVLVRRSDDGPTHLIILLHGVGGYSGHVRELAKVLGHQFGGDAIIFSPSCFTRLKTLDGVDVCAHRVMELLRPLVARHTSLRGLSLIGYSFGGLVARFLAGVLVLEPRPFLGLTPLNIVTLACPHCGPVRTEGPAHTGVRERLLRLMMHVLGSRTGAQLGLLDRRMQLLALMAHPRGVFYRGLAAFSRRAAYANITCDHSVPHWTASIAEWHAGSPLPPPPTAPQDSSTTPYPHVESVVSWAGRGGGGGTAADAENVSIAPLMAASADRPSWSQALALIFLAPLFLCSFAPFILCVALPLASTIALCKRLVNVLFPPPQLLAALQLLAPSHSGAGDDEAQEWSDPAATAALEVEVAAEGSMQQWMAARLNELSWQKVHVRFRLRSDGLRALHTHPHIIVRNKWQSPFGMDVLAHMAVTLRHVHEDSDDPRAELRSAR